MILRTLVNKINSITIFIIYSGRRFERVEIKIIKTSIVLVVLYVLMWTPIFVTMTIVVALDVSYQLEKKGK